MGNCGVNQAWINARPDTEVCMKKYSETGAAELKALLAELNGEYENKKSAGLKLDMSRGKPNVDQLVCSRDMLDVIGSKASTVSENGIECANYMGLDGIPEAKRLMAEILEAEPQEVFVGGNSSLNLMHDLMSFCYLFPLPGNEKPWSKQGQIKFLCPVPGYDRHFSVTEHFGIEMLPVPMTSTGPDMDTVEKLVTSDASIKGMWCVPKYSNPQGIVYSDDTVRRISKMKPAASDFRIFWDNAYAVHDFYPERPEKLLPLLAELKKHGNENNAFMFASTSKISFPGGGIAAVAASKENLEFVNKHMAIQTIGYDKINQLRHARFLKDINGVRNHMKLHMEIMRPKFELVLETLGRELDGLGIAAWEKPLGGYFVSLDALDGCAKRIVSLCKDAGLVMTPAGATHPYGNDPDDKTIRIAPSFPNLDELGKACDLFCLCVKIAAIEKLIG